MARQLKILALEPFYGGERKQTLELLSKHSRHQWTILKLPARRLERRLNTAAQWFTQQLLRLHDFKCDLVFTSDAMNLADFLRLNPDLGHRPSVAYSYSNQFAKPVAGDQQARLAMLSTATCATELWFNTVYFMRGFLSAAGAIFDGHPELGGKEPLKTLVAKSQLMYPPVELVLPKDDSGDSERKSRTICLDTRYGEPAILKQVLKEIAERNEPATIHVIGQAISSVPDGMTLLHTSGNDEAEIAKALRRCELFISVSRCEQFDPLAMQAMVLGCIPILPKEGFYTEFLPKSLQSWCTFDGTADDLLSRVMDLWFLKRPAVARKDLDAVFGRYTPASAVRNFDQRIEYLVEQHSH